MDKETFETIMKANEVLSRKFYSIYVDNSAAKSHNINIDHPSYFCSARSKEEAVGKMMLSDFSYKYKPITRIQEHN